MEELEQAGPKSASRSCSIIAQLCIEQRKYIRCKLAQKQVRERYRQPYIAMYGHIEIQTEL